MNLSALSAIKFSITINPNKNQIHENSREDTFGHSTTLHEPQQALLAQNQPEANTMSQSSEINQTKQTDDLFLNPQSFDSTKIAQSPNHFLDTFKVELTRPQPVQPEYIDSMANLKKDMEFAKQSLPPAIKPFKIAHRRKVSMYERAIMKQKQNRVKVDCLKPICVFRDDRAVFGAQYP